MNNFHAACGLSWLLCVWRLWHSFWDIICSYHQGLRAAPCLFSSFSNQSGCISSLPRCGRLFFFGGTADAASEANSTHFTYTKNIFLPPLLHAQLISDVACRWLLNSSALCFPPPLTPHCVPVSTNWRSVHQRKRGKWKGADWKQALCCCCCWDLFKMSCSTSSYVWHYFPDVTRLRVTLTRWSDVHASL